MTPRRPTHPAVKTARVLTPHVNECRGEWVSMAIFRGSTLTYTVHTDVLGRIGNGGQVWDLYECTDFDCPGEAIVNRAALQGVARTWIAES